MDIYVVLDGGRVVGASARQQGAEVIRADEAARITAERMGSVTTPSVREAIYGQAYAQLSIENTELRDLD